MVTLKIVHGILEEKSFHLYLLGKKTLVILSWTQEVKSKIAAWPI